ncbi:hypothetical protein FEP12_02160 [Burkholderia multivorans]|jgi:hypothetical protein|nr:hypothetical protein [Burkholderia multivorans]MDR9180353.1 hypothetical protein [Burkholderia multivorans]MDR9185802.1 hypothetical protein [Burkholderia multivorans]MDR9190898.1 hypothetical protein [Burkholderia multivorans]MDR9196769.1 hypothetical protein [Burkholderia multivorans]
MNSGVPCVLLNRWHGGYGRTVLVIKGGERRLCLAAWSASKNEAIPQDVVQVKSVIRIPRKSLSCPMQSALLMAKAFRWSKG